MSPFAAIARKWFSVSHAAKARALISSTNLLVLRPRLFASDFNRCAVSCGKRIVKVVIAIELHCVTGLSLVQHRRQGRLQGFGVRHAGGLQHVRYAASRSSGLIVGFGCCSACHKSHCVCMPNQTSGDVLNQVERRKAIPAVTPALPLSTLESVTREICKAFAASVTVIPSGSHSRRTSPGCAGLCILLIAFAPSGSPNNQPVRHRHRQR